MIKIVLYIKLMLLSMLLNNIHCQQSQDDFDFWKDGKWVAEITVYNNDTIPEKDSFVVHKLKNKTAFKEKWNIFIGEGEYVDAIVLRAYDQETKRWKLFYVDDLNAQTWDSEVIDNKIYFIKQFTYNEKTFYSRQAWSLQDDGKVLRTIERSVDKEKWTLRYWQLFKLVVD